MKLPQYSPIGVQSLGRERPGSAVAVGRAKAGATEALFGQTAKVAQTWIDAEGNAAAAKATAQAKSDLQALKLDLTNRKTLTEAEVKALGGTVPANRVGTGSVPTQEVMGEIFDKETQRITSEYGEDLSGKYAAKFQTAISPTVDQYNEDIVNQGYEWRYETINSDIEVATQTLEMAASPDTRLADITDIAEMNKQAALDGAKDTDEATKDTIKAVASYDATMMTRMVQSGDPAQVDEVEQMLADPTFATPMTAAQRKAVGEQVNKFRTRRAREADTIKETRHTRNEPKMLVGVLSNDPTMTQERILADIAKGDISQGFGQSMIKALNAQDEKGTRTDRAVEARLSQKVSAFLYDDTNTVQFKTLFGEINNEMLNHKLSKPDYESLIAKASNGIGKDFKTPDYKRTVRTMRMTLTGTEAPSSRYDDPEQDVSAVVFSSALNALDAYMDEHITADGTQKLPPNPTQWWENNRAIYEEAGGVTQSAARQVVDNLSVYKAEGGKEVVDIEATALRIDKAVAAQIISPEAGKSALDELAAEQNKRAEKEGKDQ